MQNVRNNFFSEITSVLLAFGIAASSLSCSEGGAINTIDLGKIDVPVQATVLGGSNVVEAGQCSKVFTIALQDVDGNNVKLITAAIVALSALTAAEAADAQASGVIPVATPSTTPSAAPSSGPPKFYSDPACITEVVELTVETKKATTQVYTSGNTAESYVLVAQPTISGQKLIPGLAEILVMPTTADHLAIELGADQTAVVATKVEVTPTVKVLDRYENAVPGAVVSFAVSAGGGSVENPIAVANALGLAGGAFTLGKAVGTNTLLITGYPAALPDEAASGNASVTFSATGTPAAPSDLTSTVTVAPASIVADGVTEAIVTITLKDEFGNPVPGSSPTVSSSGTLNTITQPSAVTDADGKTTAVLVSTTAEIKTVSIATPVELIAVSGAANFVAGIAVVAKSSASAVSGIVADNVATSTITLTLKDINDNPVIGVVPVLTVSGDDNTLVPPAMTDALGQTTATVRTKKAELKTVSVAAPAGLNATTTFIAGAASGAHSTIVADNNVTTDGGTSTVTINLKDVFDNPVAPVTPVLTSTGSSNTIGVAAPTVNGLTTVTIASTMAETKILGLDGILGVSGSVTFIAGAVNTVGVSGSVALIKDNCSAGFTVTALDQHRNIATAAADVVVGFGAGGAGTFYSDSACSVIAASVTILGGASTQVFYFKDTVQESLTLTATPGGLTSGSIRVVVYTNGLATALSVGQEHTCAILSGGAQCWGKNASGQLGDGTVVDRNSSGQVSFLTSGVQKIAAGKDHACAIQNGAAFCWGLNGKGQLGDGTINSAHSPVLVVSGGSSGWQEIAVGETHSCGIKNGAAYCWGLNSHGQLGDGTVFERHTPVAVSGLSSGVQAVAVGSQHTCAIKNGAVYCWGSNLEGEIGDNTLIEKHVPTVLASLTGAVVSLSASSYHTCAVVDGAAKCWGKNTSGELGDNTLIFKEVPTQVSGLGSGVQTVVAGVGHSCATVNGILKCWGDNTSGQLGDGGQLQSKTAVDVSGVNSGVLAAGAGASHSCALVGGGIKCWGLNTSGQIGDATNALKLTATSSVFVSTGAVQVVSGSQHTCALVRGGVKCWGDNALGQLGDGTWISNALPQAVTGLGSGVQALVAGANHTCAIVDGGVKCWGKNTNGQLGNNLIANSFVPVPVRNVSDTGDLLGVLEVAAGSAHTCAIVGGGVQCWGVNDHGQLGNNLLVESHVPVVVRDESNAADLSGVVEVAAGDSHSCALVSGGMRCWGANAQGQLGDHSKTDRLIPVVVRNSSNDGNFSSVSQIAAGGAHTCARVDGGAYCFGNNTSGELGIGIPGVVSPTSATNPVLVSGLSTGVESVALGSAHSCAIVNGGVKCWGLNGNGQIGDGSTLAREIPVAVYGLNFGVQGLGLGQYQSCAVEGGGVVCWGKNGLGQLGNNSLLDSSVPVTGVSLQ